MEFVSLLSCDNQLREHGLYDRRQGRDCRDGDCLRQVDSLKN